MKIITICGSYRFKKEMIEIAEKMLFKRIVLSQNAKKLE